MSLFIAFTDVDGELEALALNHITRFKEYKAPVNPKAPNSKWKGFVGTKLFLTDDKEVIVRETPEEIFAILAEIYGGVDDEDDEDDDDEDDDDLDDDGEEEDEGADAGIPENNEPLAGTSLVDGGSDEDNGDTGNA